MKTNPWFRLYNEFDSDPKVQSMPEVMQRRLIMLFCSKCRGETLQDADRAFHWRISVAEIAATKALFIEKGFIDEQWDLINWNRRQYLSDSSTERVRRHRDKKANETHETKCNADGVFHEDDKSPPDKHSETGRNVTVTPPDTDTDTDTEAEQKLSDATHPHPADAGVAASPEREIYKLYPRKEGSAAALVAIEKAVVKLVKGKTKSKRAPMVRRDAQRLLYRAVDTYARSAVGRQADKTKIPHPTTWFNQERWDDDQSNWQHTGGETHGKPRRIDEINRSTRRALELLEGMDTPAYLRGRGPDPRPAAGRVLEGTHGPTVAGNH